MALRVALTISGAVSLGSYEGGALAALLCATGPLASRPDPPLEIDVMSGASAGSVTALLAARTLLQGHDPVQVMKGAWVEGDSIGAMLSHDSDAPLSIDALRDMAKALIDPTADDGRVRPRQGSPIELSYTLACLRGLEYRLPRLGTEPITASTFIDYYQHTLDQDADLASLVTPAGSAPLDAVLASAANAMGFPPYLLDRAADRATYLGQGVDNLRPASDPSMWFTDGGTLDNEPLGRALDLSNPIDAEQPAGARRMHLLIHPHPTGAVRGAAWAAPDNPPTFVQTAARAMAMQRTQSLYDDLKRVEKTNSQIAWVNKVCESLGDALAALPAEEQGRLQVALSAVVGSIEADKGALRKQKASPGPQASQSPTPADADTLTGLLSQTIGLATGVGGKRRVAVDVISPLQLIAPGENGPAVEDMLSGEVLFHFGGFLDTTMRLNDFDLGYSSALEWLKSDALCRAGLDEADRDTAHSAAEAAYRPQDGWKETGKTTVGSLLGMHRWQAARLTGKITHVLLHDLLHHPPQ